MYYSPLRYPGGKSKLFTLVESLIASNHLEGCCYVEPYAGGAGLALALLLNKKVASIHINDYSPNIYSFWYYVAHYPDDMCKMIHDTPVTIEVWKRQKQIAQTQEISLELGYSTLFLNRTNRSGILSGGAIGGVRQEGKWRIDARFNKKTLIEKISTIAKMNNKIAVTNLDGIELLRGMESSDREKIFVYLDPPYVLQGRRLYQDYFSPDDHKALAAMLANEFTSPWLLTYDKADIIKEYYQGFEIKEYEIGYSATVPRRASELMICSRDLVLPMMKKA